MVKGMYYSYNMAPKPKEAISTGLQLKRQSVFCFNMGEKQAVLYFLRGTVFQSS